MDISDFALSCPLPVSSSLSVQRNDFFKETINRERPYLPYYYLRYISVQEAGNG